MRPRMSDTDADGTARIGENGTTVSNTYGGVYRLERDGQGQFKLTAEEIIELYHYITTGGEPDDESYTTED